MPKASFPLVLTSPLETGPLVREAQRALGNNPFGDFEPGPLDGQYGEETSRATKRAKFWLGYPESHINGHYGPFLHNFLLGGVELPRDNKARRVLRKKQALETPVGEKMLKEAKRWVGTKEHPAGSNIATPFIPWYTRERWGRVFGFAWCAVFCSYCGDKAGSQIFDPKRDRYAYCPYVVRDARAGVNYLSVTRNPRPGDLVLFDWAGDGVADHIGLFDRWSHGSRSQFLTVEGNTSFSSNSNGGEVMARQRSINDVIVFAHVSR